MLFLRFWMILFSLIIYSPCLFAQRGEKSSPSVKKIISKSNKVPDFNLQKENIHDSLGKRIENDTENNHEDRDDSAKRDIASFPKERSSPSDKKDKLNYWELNSQDLSSEYPLDSDGETMVTP